MGTAKAKRTPQYQADLMVESFGAKRAYETAADMERLGGKNLGYWYDVRKHIDYTPPPKERTTAERLYDNLVAWATEQGVVFDKNPHGLYIMIHSGQPKFAIGVCPVLPTGDADSTY